MVDWLSPATLLSQAAALDKLMLVFVGIFIYEFTCSLSFDWMLVMKSDSRRSALAKSVKWLYMVCRYSGLTTCVSLAVFVSHGQLRCSILVKAINTAGLLAVTCGTVLLFVRVGVVWEWDKRITVSFIVAYMVILAVGFRAVILIRAEHSANPFGPVCATFGVKTDLLNVFATLLVDVALLVLLFTGLWRWSRGGTFNLWHLLCNQGLIYLTLAIIIEVPMTVFLFLNYNEVVSLFFFSPLTMILPIAAMRFYRSLTSFRGGHSQYSYEATSRISRLQGNARLAGGAADFMENEMAVMDIQSRPQFSG
ncbi:hypothetical protein PENSPDRAFT_163850 [Peniophora sp. CONT]|nr:hypothetical protein PENSPDRAFT_163850 [Peniophora sp. CONT]